MSKSKDVAKPSAESLNPKTTEYEFFGPPGALAVTIGVPFLAYALYFGCNERNGCPPGLQLTKLNLQTSLTSLDWWLSLWDTKAATMYLGWYAFCVAAWAILPGDWVEGTVMRNGQRKKYKINAFSTFLLAMGAAAGYIFRFGPASFTFIYERFVGFATAALLMSIVQALYVYWSSFQKGALLALGGNTGNPIYDFFIGRELNPSIGSFDIKTFNEIRPGLILWSLIDISMACEQATRLGGWPSPAMLLVCAFQIFYVVDCLYNEPTMLTTMDITTDGFGFMLSVGDLLWVPFVYSLQARYLAFHNVELSPLAVVGILGANFLGYYIFRASNGEKNDFRNGRNPKNLQFFTTESGSKLLTSGWWGWLRHPNYLGDLIMAFSWSLPTGFNTPITYFYFVYFFVLLVHRDSRDDHNCHKKYGKDWEKYKQMVKYTIVPYVY
ncbi:ERG4/ERG24 ergosterol biosynthesis protein [Auricularia subglabra TFB-10046 SS5]|nr:ERG4/ERG24 ergosterol biosynthesis protein [Auricularia subglabra TFB-10046 SS5]